MVKPKKTEAESQPETPKRYMLRQSTIDPRKSLAEYSSSDDSSCVDKIEPESVDVPMVAAAYFNAPCEKAAKRKPVQDGSPLSSTIDSLTISSTSSEGSNTFLHTLPVTADDEPSCLNGKNNLSADDDSFGSAVQNDNKNSDIKIWRKCDYCPYQMYRDDYFVKHVKSCSGYMKSLWPYSKQTVVSEMPKFDPSGLENLSDDSKKGLKCSKECLVESKPIAAKIDPKNIVIDPIKDKELEVEAYNKFENEVKTGVYQSLVPGCKFESKDFGAVVAHNHYEHNQRPKYECNDCGRWFQHKVHLMHHKVHKQHVVCNKCEETFKYQSELDRHFIAHRNATHVYPCCYCKLEFLNVEARTEHCRIKDHDWQQVRKMMKFEN